MADLSEEKRNELQHRAERLADETVLSEQEAEWWVYSDAGLSTDEIGLEMGRSNDTVFRVQNQVRDRLREVWQTIEMLDLDEGQNDARKW